MLRRLRDDGRPQEPDMRLSAMRTAVAVAATLAIAAPVFAIVASSDICTAVATFETFPSQK